MQDPSCPRRALAVAVLLVSGGLGCSPSTTLETPSKEPPRADSARPGAAPASAPVASVPRAPSAVPSGTASEIAAIPKSSKTHGFTACTAAKPHLNGAKLTVEQLAPLAASIEKGLCWGYFDEEVTADKLAASLQSCANAIGSTAFEVSLELQKGQCTVEVGAASLGDRVFVRTQETYVTQVLVGKGPETTAGVGYKLNAFEAAGDKLTPLFDGMPCEALDDPKLEVTGTIHKKARDEWKQYPSELRQWFCR